MAFTPMQQYFAEFIGTMVLILLGDGVCANVSLAKNKGNSSGWIVIATGWGLAVAFAAYITGWVSGAHINPAVTIAFAAIGVFPWAMVPGFIIAQMLGAFVGAVLVYIAYKDHFDATDDAAAKLGTFATGPAVRNLGRNTVTEIVGTAILVLGLLGISHTMGGSGTVNAGMSSFVAGFLIFSIGLSLGGPTGYAINPARDLGPRIAHAVLPIKGKGSSDWSYGLTVPIIGPIIGGILGGLLWVVFLNVTGI
ncbi:MIP/aquaporin family protein [Sediminispirochaeta bajacaliforniensis]|jgi:glycerol uptake facilitator protein|uniref:MIP/aquaporin family protein n=1 Tax=Sediminispirochaeta bajacaliforniensis TaxID=148 RepID=UPI00036FE676|nr:MIP/aquaporin family protein [Sediminispirochaeta bajacaliforniensis]